MMVVGTNIMSFALGGGVSGPPSLRITVLYRQPGPAPDSFLHDLESLRSTYTNNHIILGDFNIDFLDENISYGYKTVISTYAFVNLITVPTRITSHRKSSLGHILLNFSNEDLKSGTV